jgi:protease I
MAQLSNTRVAVIATDGFEEVELTEPVKALKDAGATVDVVSTKQGNIQAFRHHDKSITVPVDRTLDEVSPSEYDAVLLPGGALNADKIRVEPKLKSFLKESSSAGKPMAVICHAPWELISAGLAKGRTITSYHTIQDDVRNAGANWVDQEVVVDGNLVTSRQPSDIPAFNREMINLFARTPAGSRR